MNSSCINILNKTVNQVCSLEKNVHDNSKNIDFLEKYCTFNKNLILASLGCNVSLDYQIYTYTLDKCFLNNYLYQYLLYVILNYLNNNNKENYFFVVKDRTNLPEELKNICVPSLLQVSLIEGESCVLPHLFREIKDLDFDELSKMVQQKNCQNLSSLTISILKFLCCPADICFSKCCFKTLTKDEICPFYDYLLKTKKEVCLEMNELINKYKSLCLNVVDPIEGTQSYLKLAQETLDKNYYQKSFNNPFFPKYNIHDIFCEAYKLFICDNNLEVDCQGNVYQSDEPFEPYEPSEPSEPSDFKFTMSSINEKTLSNILTDKSHDESIENRIKELLELTETTT